MKSRRLTFYLLREGVDRFEDALDSEKLEHSDRIDTVDGVDGCFVFNKPRQSTPPWVSFVQPILTEQLDGVRSASASALLLLRSCDRIFAVTFGFGRTYLNLSKVEYQFGLRVALNVIDPQQIRSLDTKTFEDLVVSTNTQVSKSAELPTFGVDISRDILRSVTGQPRDNLIATRIAGADSLVMSLKTEVAELPKLCGQLLDLYKSESYKADFGWIDQLALVRDQEAISALDELLVKQLRTESAATTHLAMPEPISWEDIDGFTVAGTGAHLYVDLDLDEYLTRLGAAKNEITLAKLKSRGVSVRFGRSGFEDKRWSLYQCLVSEQRTGGQLCVLIEGRWFIVDDSLLEEVDHFLDAVQDSRVNLIPARRGEAESDYNKRLAQSSPETLLNLDAKIKRPGGASSGIEFCDVLSDSGDLIHIKRKSRSSTLSHLFAQGIVSATTFLNDGYFRGQVRNSIENDTGAGDRQNWLNIVPGDDQQVERMRYWVTFAVIANSNRQGRDWLPFFSKLNLMQHGRNLRNLGFGVAISRIPIEN
ncbi:DUF6119 family protein [Brevibacterium linens]|uniref:DUF6119 family protein n=1 Tax=Brevibacterium linens TaxID=1703 RepID=UPI003515D33B